MLRTNYRCFQSLNNSVDVVKCVEMFHKFTLYTHFLFITKKWLVLTEQSIHGKVSTHWETNYRCVQSLNMSVDIAKCVENFHKFIQYTQFLSVTRKDLSWLNYLSTARFQLIRMVSYAKNKL